MILSSALLHCTGAAVFDRWLCLAITPHHDVAITTCLMVLCPLSIVFFGGVELRSLKLGGESLKVCIDELGDRQLPVVVQEGELVLTLFRHLHPHSCLAYPTTLGPVSLQQVFSSIAMKTALAKVLALPVLALNVEGAVEVLDPSVVKFAGHFNQQQIDPWLLVWLLAEAPDSYALVPAKYIDGQHFSTLWRSLKVVLDCSNCLLMR